MLLSCDSQGVLLADGKSTWDPGNTPFIVQPIRSADPALRTAALSPQRKTKAAAVKAPTQLVATATSASQIRLTWRDSNRNETAVFVERSTNGRDFNVQVRLPAGTTRYTDRGLAAGKKYFYRVRVKTPEGYSPYSSIASSTTPNPSVAPAVPSKLTASAVSYSQIRLNWQDNSNNETGFVIERSTDGASFTKVATVAKGKTSYTDPGLDAATTYYYRVYAKNAAGESGYSNVASIKTKDLPPAPAAPSGLTVTVVSESRLRLSWQDSSDNETGFIVERSTDGAEFTPIATTSANIRSYTDTGLTASTKYYYRVCAKNVGGNSEYSAIASATTAAPQQPPVAPSNLVATAKSTSRIDLSWRDNSSNETGFIVERSSDGINFTVVAQTAAGVARYSNTGLTASTKYYYRVSAKNSGGPSDYSNAANATTFAKSGAPAAPSDLTARALSTTQIKLTWRDNSNDETAFEVLRSTDGVTFSLVASTSANATSYTNMGLVAGTTYYYQVRAKNAAGVSASTSTASAKTQGQTGQPTAPSNLLATATSTTQIKLTWRDNSNNEAGFVVERSEDGTHFTQISMTLAGQTQYTDMGRTPSTTYYYRVCARNGAGNSAYATANATTPTPSGSPVAPADLAATARSTSQVELTWRDQSNNESVFVLERSTDGTSFTEIATVPAGRTSYTDSELKSGTTYYYRVRARNLSGPSSPSNVATVTMP